MQRLRALWFRLRTVGARERLESEFDEELQYHIERETEANIARGHEPVEARRIALAAFGGVERFKESLRDEHSVRWLHEVSSDLKHGVRLIRKNVLFSSAVVGTLALGIGATSTIFTIVNGVLLQKPNYPQPERVVSISQAGNSTDAQVSHVNYKLLRQSQHSLSTVALYGGTSGILTGAGEPVDVRGAQVTASFFNVLDGNPAFGRLVNEADEAVGSERVVVLSHPFWSSTFGGDSSIVGRTITFDGTPRRVIGVMPATFNTPSTAKYWVPLRLGMMSDQVEYYFSMIGRLKPGMTLDAARRDLQPVLTRRYADQPAALQNAQVNIVSLHERRFGSVKRPLTLLFGAVVMLLLVACVNVANLTLARSVARRREFAVRLALGASRMRLARQLFIETSILAALGGGIGALVPFALVGVFVKLSPASVAGIEKIHVDGTVLAFTAGATVLAALLFGLVPALTGARSGHSSALNAGNARSSGTRAHGMIRSSLVTVEIAAALVLLTGAGLLTKSFSRSLAVDIGFHPEHVYAANVQLPRARYQDDASENAFYAEMAERIRAVPGIENVALTDILPFRGSSYGKLVKRNGADGATIQVMVGNVSGEFSRLIGLHLVAGRYIDARDRIGTEAVAMVTPAYVKEFFPDGQALGRRLKQYYDDSTNFPTVVGIIDPIPRSKIDEPERPAVILAAEQNRRVPTYVIIRTTLDESVVQKAMKQVVTAIDAKQPLTDFFSMQDVVEKANAPQRFNSVLINAFAALALILAIIGLYGLMAHAVIARTRELGIRIALGAATENLLRLVLRQGLMLTAAGIVGGVALSFALARTLAGLLYGVTTHDPFVFTGAPFALAIVALAACYIPARRATRVNPIVALRQD